jgi:hypothetical protein
VRQDPLDQLRFLDARDHSQPPAAACALLDLDPELGVVLPKRLRLSELDVPAVEVA